MKKVLISGGSGLVGKTLTELLKKQGVEVHWLSTRKGASAEGVTVHFWNPKSLEIEKGALQGIDTIFHLAGANVAQRWTEKNKRDIMDSRVMGTQTLYKAIAESDQKPSRFISASAVGYYPSDYEKFYTEDASPATDFLGSVVTEWEREVDRISSLGSRVVKLRIGIVLDKSGGALGQMIPAFKFGVGSPLGSGKQWMPWIHMEDLARMFIHAAKTDEMTGAYNAAAENQVRNREFGRCLAVAMRKPYFFPAVPAFALKLLLGQMAQIALMSTHISVDRMKEAGFEWKHPELIAALKDVLGK
ncbi:TIGR01777 family oxidoreductase [Phaeocystidibacter luteus]|uniref:TIGR01777 family protein n=1 Tax=Phaeocystidibacter luteus TaxID=911197 RepID=A0A6N6RML2_9FLAO|nr:TIGR01777 family oxidoreductase [Phaeocystidibacter luteus]KAB2814788.1 TIGR01777 family protein [Phaeocystidibacter luteus]